MANKNLQEACPVPASRKLDLQFSSTSEVKNFVRSQLGQPGNSQQNGAFQVQPSFDGGLFDLKGVDLAAAGPLTSPVGVLFRLFLNPVDFDGSTWTQTKEAYKTNELGFFIGVSFLLALTWSFTTYRRSAIAVQQKRYLY